MPPATTPLLTDMQNDLLPDAQAAHRALTLAKQGRWRQVQNELDLFPSIVNVRPGNRNWGIIHFAANRLNFGVVKILVEKYGADLALRTKDGHTCKELMQWQIAMTPGISPEKRVEHKVMMQYVQNHLKPGEATDAGDSESDDSSEYFSSSSEGGSSSPVSRAHSAALPTTAASGIVRTISAPAVGASASSGSPKSAASSEDSLDGACFSNMPPASAEGETAMKVSRPRTADSRPADSRQTSKRSAASGLRRGKSCSALAAAPVFASFPLQQHVTVQACTSGPLPVTRKEVVALAAVTAEPPPVAKRRSVALAALQKGLRNGEVAGIVDRMEEEEAEAMTNDVPVTEFTNIPYDDIPKDLPPPRGGSSPSRPCRYGEKCRKLWAEDEDHKARFTHPAISGLDYSRPGDKHAGTRYPRAQCRGHPGCPRRFKCHYSHGLIRSAATKYFGDDTKKTCFLAEPPYSQDCREPTWNGESFEFCSEACREKARTFKKGILGCRRTGCPCPYTVNGVMGQFCCQTCADGTPCPDVTHTLPTAHLVVIPRGSFIEGKYQPCARADCACAGQGGSTWNGAAGEFCSRSCRNGTPCVKLWHSVPEAVALAQLDTQFRGIECGLAGCPRTPWNGMQGEFCCIAHRHMSQGNTSAEDYEEVDHLYNEKKAFPDFDKLWTNAESWARAVGDGGSKGKVMEIWKNESMSCPECPARIAFLCAVEKAGLDSWDDGEFGWHGTKALTAVQGICWSNLDCGRRSGQCFGRGEYFSRGTQAGLNYSMAYAGGDSGHLMIIFWIMSHQLGAAPRDPGNNGACASSGQGHIVVDNPGNHEMYCIPIGVVAFGSGIPKPMMTVSAQGGSVWAGSVVQKIVAATSADCDFDDMYAKPSDSSTPSAPALMIPSAPPPAPISKFCNIL